VVNVHAAMSSLELATSRDEIVLAILHGMSGVARRVGILAVRRNSFHGWACTKGFAEENAFRTISIDRAADTILAEAVEQGWYLGPIPKTKAHEPLSALLSDATGEVAIVSVELARRPAMLILAAQLCDTMIASRTAEQLARAGAEALLRVLRMEKSQR